MKLMAKFNLILLVLFGIGGLAISQVAYMFLLDSARREVFQQAEVLLATADAAREYTSESLVPLLTQLPERQDQFHKERVPAVSAIALLAKLQQLHPVYGYKPAALKPRNPDHLATCWEIEIINWLQKHPNEKQKEGIHEGDDGKLLYLAKPIRMDDISCLECHTTPGGGPPAMVKQYGETGGFGWKEDEVVAAEIVAVPMTEAERIAKQAYHRLLVYLLVTLIVTIIALDAGVYYLVIRPLQIVSATADRISTGEKDVPPLHVRGKDEIATVTESFNRMQMSLAKAFKMLD